MYGSTQHDSFPVFPEGQSNLQESTAATYTGVLATLFVAPLAWCRRDRRSSAVFWALSGFFALGWCLNVPGLVGLLRLPGLNMLSHNRLVFATSFAILAITALGLDSLFQGPIQRRWWFWVPAAALAGLCAWCIYRVMFPPEPRNAPLDWQQVQSEQLRWFGTLSGVGNGQAWFVRHFSAAAVCCGLGVLCWLSLWFSSSWRGWRTSALGALLLGDLLWFAHGRSAQCDPALYYPPVPVLDQAARMAPGRIMGYSCLPPSLALVLGMSDIRGFDGVDPARMIDLLRIAGDSRSGGTSYGFAQWLAPKLTFTPEGSIRISPILDMLAVRYLIFRETPPSGVQPALSGADYWVLDNPAALPRAFIPRRVEFVADDDLRLQRLARPDFDARDLAYVESPVTLPSACEGTARIVKETPTRITISVQMQTPGMVVLADLWDKGWHASLNGKPVPILRANHALRGVLVPGGPGTLEFCYAPRSFAFGLALSALAGVVLLGWLAIVVQRSRK
jgi:hypothetical protein